jgi:hypothetical protein
MAQARVRFGMNRDRCQSASAFEVAPRGCVLDPTTATHPDRRHTITRLWHREFGIGLCERRASSDYAPGGVADKAISRLSIALMRQQDETSC